MSKIPKHIFITMPCKDKGVYTMKLVEKNKLFNKDWTFNVYDDYDCDLFIAGLKNDMYKIVYYQLIPGAYKADFIRLLLLYKYGGVYLDAGLELKIQLNKLLMDKHLLLTNDLTLGFSNGIWNAFMAATPKHPFIKMCIKNLVMNVSSFVYGQSSWCVTGPLLIYKTFNQYSLNKNKDDIVFCNWNRYNGLTYMHNTISTTKSRKYREYLKRYSNEKHRYSYLHDNKKIYKALISSGNWTKCMKSPKIKYCRLYANLKYDNKFNQDYVSLPLDNSNIQLENCKGFFKSTIHYIPNNIFQRFKHNSWFKWKDSFDYRLFDTQQKIEAFFKQYFTDKILTTFKNLPTDHLKTHFWKYCVIYKFGGIFASNQINCLLDPSIYLKNKTYLVISPKNNKVFNHDIFAAPAKSPIVKTIIDLFIEKMNSHDQQDNISTYLTGPEILTDGIRKYLKKDKFDLLNYKYDKIKELYVIPQQVFNNHCITYND